MDWTGIVSQKRILVLDDEVDFCNFVEEVARDLGHATRTLTDPRMFAAAFNEFKPDIVVLDIVMPEMDGFDILRDLFTENQSIKLVIVTGQSPTYIKAAELLTLARGHSEITTFHKPVSVEALRTVLA